MYSRHHMAGTELIPYSAYNPGAGTSPGPGAVVTVSIRRRTLLPTYNFEVSKTYLYLRSRRQRYVSNRSSMPYARSAKNMSPLVWHNLPYINAKFLIFAAVAAFTIDREKVFAGKQKNQAYETYRRYFTFLSVFPRFYCRMRKNRQPRTGATGSRRCHQLVLHI